MSTASKLGFFFSDHHSWLLQCIQRQVRNHADTDRYYYEDQDRQLYGTPRNYTVTLRGSF